MKTLKTLFAIAILSISCSKDNDEPQPETPKVATVYVGGSEVNAATFKNIPTIWKNGVVQQLPLSAGFEGEVKSIFIVGETVYAVGYERLDNMLSTYRAVLWKNGLKTNLSTNSSTANDIFVTNGKTYIVGKENQIATLWLDNTAQILANGEDATGVFVKNNEIYISGKTVNGGGYWKSTSPQPNYLIDSAGPSQARSISINDNNDVIIAGSAQNSLSVISGRLWNSNAISPEKFENGTSMWSVHTQGTNVYACGFTASAGNVQATLWKNNQPTKLSQNKSNANSVFATATDTYVAGNEENQEKRACIWKNGSIQILSILKSVALCVFVTEK